MGIPKLFLFAGQLKGFIGQNILWVDIDDRAKVCKSVNGREFIPFQIVRNGLLRNTEPFTQFGLCHSALFDRIREIFLHILEGSHVCSLHLLGVSVLDIRPTGVIYYYYYWTEKECRTLVYVKPIIFKGDGDGDEWVSIIGE